MLRFAMHIGNRTPSIDASTSTAPSEPEEVFCGGCDASLAPEEVLKCPCTAAVYCSSVCQAAAWPTHQTRCSAARRQQTVLICSNCRRTSMTMHACRCGQTFYCNHDCQKRHWFRHAHMCATLIHKHTARIEHKSTQAGKGDISDTSDDDDDDEGKEDDSEDTRIITTLTGKVQSHLPVESSSTVVVSPRRQSVDSPLRDLPSYQTSTPMASFVRHGDTETIHPNAIKSPSPTSLGDVLVSQNATASAACLPRTEGRRDHQVTTQVLPSFGDDAEVEGLTVHIATLEHPPLLPNAATLMTGISGAGGGIGISCLDEIYRGEDIEGSTAGEFIPNDADHPETENPLQIHTNGADNNNKLSLVPPRIRRRQRAKHHPVTIKYTANNPYVSRRGHSLSPSALNPFEMLPMIQVTVAEPKNSRDSSDSDNEPRGAANLIAADRGGDTLHTQHHQLQERTLSGTISSCGASSQSMLKIAVYTDLNDRWSSKAPFGYKPTAADETKTRKICRTSVLIVPK